MKTHIWIYQIKSNLDPESRFWIRSNEDSRLDGCTRDEGSQQVEVPPAANLQMLMLILLMILFMMLMLMLLMMTFMIIIMLSY